MIRTIASELIISPVNVRRRFNKTIKKAIQDNAEQLKKISANWEYETRKNIKKVLRFIQWSNLIVNADGGWLVHNIIDINIYAWSMMYIMNLYIVNYSKL